MDEQPEATSLAETVLWVSFPPKPDNAFHLTSDCHNWSHIRSNWVTCLHSRVFVPIPKLGCCRARLAATAPAHALPHCPGPLPHPPVGGNTSVLSDCREPSYLMARLP